ncbi:hypothetical protein SAMN04488065_1806 [Haloplanus vescus]|uniref:Uncharacterized protein n=1 Tax=Haloplanus vescus TaxID=555874 RepID=A0A1H3YF00_9EURY|nr:hypothetical protein [Haloplanus vescus]SEA09498.1 hypothetical protein SAMN04488065_1806 [Haloplanus vescus]
MASSPIPSLDSEQGADSLDEALAVPDATVAIVGPPFAGREATLDRAADTLDGATRIRAGPDAPVGPSPLDGPTILDDCHHGYAHHVGGFDPLDDFLDRLASASGRTVTSWNRYSWNYLDAVRNVGNAFGHVFSLASLSADGVAEVLRSTTDAWPAFEYATDGDASPFTSVEYRPPIPNREVTLQLPTVDVDYVTSWLRGGESPSPETLVFQRLARLTGGNPGVVAAAWEASVAGRESITPDDIALPVDRGFDVDDDAARVLGILVSKESVSRTELAAATTGVSLDRTLGWLASHGFVVDADPVRLHPGSLPSALSSLERRRWLW